MSMEAVPTMAAEPSNNREQVARRVFARVRERQEELQIPESGPYGWATKAGVDRSQLHKMKYGQVAILDHRLVAMEEALQLPYGELLKLAGRPAPAITTATSVSVSILAADDLEDHEKRALLEVYESFRRGRQEREA